MKRLNRIIKKALKNLMDDMDELFNSLPDDEEEVVEVLVRGKAGRSTDMVLDGSWVAPDRKDPSRFVVVHQNKVVKNTWSSREEAFEFLISFLEQYSRRKRSTSGV